MHPFASSLSFRLLLLTIAFVMLAEILIYTPSIARFRDTYLKERLAAAHLAALAMQATPDGVVTQELATRLLDHVGAYRVGAMQAGQAKQKLSRPMVPRPDAVFDLESADAMMLIIDAFRALAQTSNRVILVRGPSPKDADLMLSVLMEEGPMRRAMYDFSVRILALSVVISLFSAALVYLTLRWLMVRPMERITRSMVAFRSNPEDYASDVPDAGRRDEIGTAVRELASMKAGLRQALRQQTRLATLGTAVNKINHDLRNMLSTATMISDRLSDSADPDVRRVAPTLIRAIDRAARLCLQTLNFTRDTPALQIDEVPLADLLGDLRGMFEADGGQPLGIEFDDRDTTVVRVDRDQIHRVFANLARNAAAAGAGCLSVSASSQAGRVRITIADDGPGIPPAAHDKLFRPFLYSTAADGYGLGLAIARDIAQAHGGRLALLRSDAAGTAFMLELPQGQAAATPPEPEPAVAQQA